MCKNIFFGFVTMMFLCFLSFAQDKNSTAPIKWEKYKVKENNVSVLLPKMPVLVESSNICAGESIKRYGVYADKVIYGMNIYSKSNDAPPPYCPSNQGKFNADRFLDRIEQVKKEIKATDEASLTQDGLELTKIKGEYLTCWLVDDLKNNRWFELYVVGAEETNQMAVNFVKSFKIENKPEGIEIKNGSEQTLGDEQISDEGETSETVDKKMYIYLKPFAKYTEEARRKRVQGTVLLKITFFANGSIGDITPVKELPNGLTEQAIAAAKKIVFIPRIEKGKPQISIKQVEYSFSIY
ncbi:MAG: energy transducer TonB [Pyrinomonadaceae bacterium]